jgi:uncharacterized protein (TIGR02444 family)
LAIEFPDSELWRFAVEVYGRPGVAPACLELQARHQLDVNLLLYGLWVGARRGAVLGEGEWRSAERAARVWHRRVVKGLRGVRVELKTLIETLPAARQAEARAIRAAVKSRELDAEHLELLLLESWAPAARRDGADAARRNARACVRRRAGRLNRADSALIEAVCRAGDNGAN